MAGERAWHYLSSDRMRFRSRKDPSSPFIAANSASDKIGVPVSKPGGEVLLVL